MSAFQVDRVAGVARIVSSLSRRALKAYEAAVDELQGRGCAAGGKKLVAHPLGDYPMCERSLYADWRMFTVYPQEFSVVIIALGRHTSDSAPVETLAEVFPGLSPTGRRRSNQPPCCGDAVDPPEVSEELRDVLDEVFGLI